MTAIGMPGQPLTGRYRAILAAVAAGRAELSCSCEPDLFIDGLCFCDQETARHLVHAGLITRATAGVLGSRVAAVLTALGTRMLSFGDNGGTRHGGN